MNLAKESGATTHTSRKARDSNIATPRRPESFPGTARRAIRCRLSKTQGQGVAYHQPHQQASNPQLAEIQILPPQLGNLRGFLASSQSLDTSYFCAMGEAAALGAAVVPEFASV
jgi:hypothetical protein